MSEDPELAFRVGAKRMMRRRFRGLRAAMPRAAIEQRSRQLCERLLAQPELDSARRVALFWPIERFKEVDLRAADRALRERGVAVAYPTIDPVTDRMTFLLVDDPEGMAERSKGFREPPETCPEADRLDVIVVPGLAFDARGYRIGYGAGYYDRTLPRYRPLALAIGVAFDFQLAADIPHHEHDVPVDRVITDARELTVA